MNDLPISDLLVATTSGGLSIGVGIYAAREMGRGIRWLIEFFTGRQDKRQEHIDDATVRLIKGLEARIEEERQSRITESERRDKVEGELRGELSEVRTALRKCQEQHAESNAKVKELEGLLTGFGNANQHAQLIVSAEAAKRKGAGK